MQREWLHQLLVVFLMGSILGPVLCNVFINWMMRWNAPLVSLQVKLWGVAGELEDRAAMLRDLNRLEKWAGRNLMKFNKGKCKVLHLEQINDWIESSSAEKDLGKLSMTQQCTLAAMKTTNGNAVLC